MVSASPLRWRGFYRMCPPTVKSKRALVAQSRRAKATCRCLSRNGRCAAGRSSSSGSPRRGTPRRCACDAPGGLTAQPTGTGMSASRRGHGQGRGGARVGIPPGQSSAGACGQCSRPGRRYSESAPPAVASGALPQPAPRRLKRKPPAGCRVGQPMKSTRTEAILPSVYFALTG
jgi:hypothetical protein